MDAHMFSRRVFRFTTLVGWLFDGSHLRLGNPGDCSEPFHLRAQQRERR